MICRITLCFDLYNSVISVHILLLYVERVLREAVDGDRYGGMVVTCSSLQHSRSLVRWSSENTL
jgi:hypothetical protein